jgi:hypothetical protein
MPQWDSKQLREKLQQLFNLSRAFVLHDAYLAGVFAALSATRTNHTIVDGVVIPIATAVFR